MKIGPIVSLLALTLSSQAAELNRPTVEAWNEYVASATARMQQRLRPEHHFLEIDEGGERASKVRHGEIVVLHGGSQGLTPVPGGTIHDWLGAAFIPGTTLHHVLMVTRDYDDYKNFYRPAVVDSKTVSTDGREFEFSMILTAKSGITTTTLETDSQCSFAKMDDQRWYSTCDAIHVREIQDYGTPGERKLPEGTGKGFIWRLFSITRYEERDGGVYVELEVIALSRDIPASLRWLVNPVVRRVSRESLATSLRQTEMAVLSERKLVSSSIHTADGKDENGATLPSVHAPGRIEVNRRP